MSKMSTAEAAKLLGIDMSTNPSPDEVKKAYRKEALIWCETIWEMWCHENALPSAPNDVYPPATCALGAP